MRTISFRAELGINKGFDEIGSQEISTEISELCSMLQQLQKEVEDQTGVYISTVVSGPNRCVYRKELACPPTGEITYTIHATSDARLQLKETQWSDLEWKKTALILADKLMKHYEQEFMPVEFADRCGITSYILNQERDIQKCVQELEADETSAGEE